ncbi:MAG: RNase J family beta-CASP ribonuclease, partial [Actinomycetales bacterium]|nr:RNase J family beta-CASP ribonuclease [Actinomycetales bacterium]
LARDGHVVDLVDGVAKVVGAYPCGYVYVDGSSVGEITEDELRDRRVRGAEGIISVVALVDLETKTIVSGPTLHARGIAESDHVFDSITPDLAKALQAALDDGEEEPHALQQVLRRKLGSFAGRKLRRRPMILPVVHIR